MGKNGAKGESKSNDSLLLRINAEYLIMQRGCVLAQIRAMKST